MSARCLQYQLEIQVFQTEGVLRTHQTLTLLPNFQVRVGTRSPHGTWYFGPDELDLTVRCKLEGTQNEDVDYTFERYPDTANAFWLKHENGLPGATASLVPGGRPQAPALSPELWRGDIPSDSQER